MSSISRWKWCILSISCVVLAWPQNPAQAAGRVFYDGFEDGTTNAWTAGSGVGNLGKCPVVSSASDGGTGPRTGTKMAGCNWNGQDPNGPGGAGHSHTELQKIGWSKTRESLIRLRFRVDSDLDQKAGSKLFRAPGNISFAAVQFEEGSDPSFFSTIFKSNNQQIGTTNWGCGGNFRNGQWHSIEIYLLESTGSNSDGLARIWTDDALCWEALNQNTTDPQGSSYWADLHLMSNWSISETGWDHDTNNHIYWDDIEIFSDTGTGGTGTLSAGTMTQGGTDTTPPAAPTGLGVN